MKMERQVRQYFFSVLHDMQPGDRENLFAATQRGAANLYMWDPHTQTAVRPQDGEVPWYITYLLSFSSKHIFGSGSRVSTSSISRAVDSWISKIRWKVNLADHTSENPWCSIVRSKLPVKPAPPTGSHRLEKLLGRSSDKLKQAYIGSLYVKNQKRNLFALLGVKMLKNRNGLRSRPIRTGAMLCLIKTVIFHAVTNLLNNLLMLNKIYQRIRPVKLSLHTRASVMTLQRHWIVPLSMENL